MEFIILDEADYVYGIDWAKIGNDLTVINGELIK